ncbi:hypothetical protein KRX51_08630 [Corynebacterium sp. TAE3-ERU12]|uniref:hypothetical protein n=1 Tax=Corynebacterium sp. TAE3-ERU12 TaxID=2849491 RepID=UPI001C4964CC|nr:hypothetical protein [Corynebacterium sp. TAE3-ERU12]MBV7295973.1 hypothetical protein [Corynebacterium sp. TAE3-ERU12]
MTESSPAQRAPRRSRFSGRSTADGDRLHEVKHGRHHHRRGRTHHHSRPAPDFRDADERLDDLDLRHTTTGTGLLGTRLNNALQRPREALTFLFTSPGRLTLTAVLLIISILATGFSITSDINHRQENLTRMASQSEPLSHAAQNLYSALSVADASANTAFSRGVNSSVVGLRRDYDDAIAQAALAGTQAATGITDVDSPAMQDISTVQRLLPVYTGLVETARTNTRQGNPVGVSYLAEASGLMQEQILPAAATLYRSTTQSVARDRPTTAGIPVQPLFGLFITLLALVLTQWWITRRTRRLINPGLAVATILLAFTLLGLAGTAAFSWRGPGTDGYTEPVELLTEARITAQQARASETLDLVNRRAGSDSDFDSSAAKINGLLSDIAIEAERGKNDGRDQTILAAAGALAQWEASHDQMSALMDVGDYSTAMTIATGEGIDGVSSVESFRTLDTALREAIAESRQDLRTQIEEARTATAILSSLVVFVSVLAAICVALGFRNPLLEYL